MMQFMLLFNSYTLFTCSILVTLLLTLKNSKIPSISAMHITVLSSFEWNILWLFDSPLFEGFFVFRYLEI